MTNCSDLFKIDTLGNFSVLESNKSYQNYLIYFQAENEFGITGGSDQYLIDLSYKVIPQIFLDFGTVVVLISENMTG